MSVTPADTFSFLLFFFIWSTFPGSHLIWGPQWTGLPGSCHLWVYAFDSHCTSTGESVQKNSAVPWPYHPWGDPGCCSCTHFTQGPTLLELSWTFQTTEVDLCHYKCRYTNLTTDWHTCNLVRAGSVRTAGRRWTPMHTCRLDSALVTVLGCVTQSSSWRWFWPASCRITLWKHAKTQW